MPYESYEAFFFLARNCHRHSDDAPLCISAHLCGFLCSWRYDFGTSLCAVLGGSFVAQLTFRSVTPDSKTYQSQKFQKYNIYNVKNI